MDSKLEMNAANLGFRILVILMLNVFVAGFWMFILMGNVNSNPRFPPQSSDQLRDLIISYGPYAFITVSVAASVIFLALKQIRLSMIFGLAPFTASLILMALVSIIRTIHI